MFGTFGLGIARLFVGQCSGILDFFGYDFTVDLVRNAQGRTIGTLIV